jgi:hypothetical protein
MPPISVTPFSLTITPTITTSAGPTVSVTSLTLAPTSISSVDPTPEEYALMLAINRLKALYNEHLVDPGVHVNNDTVNGVTIVDAVNFEDAKLLIANICTEFNDHRVQTGVHANVVTIRLEAPDGLKYKDIKFFREETGTVDLLGSFSDDENLVIVPVPV